MQSRWFLSSLLVSVVSVCVASSVLGDDLIRKRPDFNPVDLEKARKLGEARDRVFADPTAQQKSQLELAKEIARAARQHLPVENAEVKMPREMRKDGVYLLLSFSLPDATLREYVQASHTYGITICLRGLVENSFKTTRERVMALFLDANQQPDLSMLTGLVIDPVIYQRAGVQEVPAVVVVQGERYQSAVGTASVRHLFGLLAKDEPGLRPFATWLAQRETGWAQGGPTVDPQPPVPALSDSRHIKSEFPTVAIGETDMLQLVKDKVAHTDWQSVQRKGAEMVKRKLERGPGLQAPRALHARTFRVDLTTEFPEDITDPSNNRILVKAGTRVNPLTKVTWPHTMLIINATDPDQVSWLQRYMDEHSKELLKVAVTAGSIEPLMTKVEHRVFWMTDELMQRFKIAALPSVVRQVGSEMEVREYAVR